MGLPYHTHTFEVPEASADEVAQRLQVSKFVTPDKLPEIVESDPADFATAAQGTLADSAVQPGDLATVATTGAYSDLSGKPTLGTAAAENVGYFATAAQGALADSAVQPADITAGVTTTGNMVVNGGTYYIYSNGSANANFIFGNSSFAAKAYIWWDWDDDTLSLCRADFVNIMRQNASGSWQINGNTIWHGGNDGAASGLDADLLDGNHASAFQPIATVLTNTTASFTTADETKLDGIEALADVTDATNVAAAGAAMLATQNQALTGGATVTSLALNGGSAVTSGTLTLDLGDCPLQHYTNGGAHTLAPGSVNSSALVDITNNGSAGAITTSGWTKVSGSSFTTTNGHKFRCHCSVGNGGSLLIVQALQ